MIVRTTIISLITLYQRTVSPDHGPLRAFHPFGYCRYFPTCSEYAKHACMKYGCVRGGIAAAWRIIRCNPWSKGGIDFVN